jgi:pimeloyl-ACP methyl ester carboxylesterase
MPAGTPTTAPPRIPNPTDPAAQPISAPTPTEAAVVAERSMPAPAGSNVGRELSVIAASISELVTPKRPLSSTKKTDFRPTLFTRYRGRVDRLVLVHGSVGTGPVTWSAQAPLAERFELVVVERSGYPPNPPQERIDFAEQADELAAALRPGDHLVGHSYGGVVVLLAAPRVELRSLTVNEPPAFGLARGNSAVEEFLAKMEHAPRTPRQYLEYFLPLVGVDMDVPAQLAPAFEAAVRAAMVERPPHEAEVPLELLAKAPFPKLVVTGAHNPALDAVADVLERELPAERAVLPGAGHNLPRAPGYNETLERFLAAA